MTSQAKRKAFSSLFSFSTSVFFALIQSSLALRRVCTPQVSGLQFCEAAADKLGCKVRLPPRLRQRRGKEKAHLAAPNKMGGCCKEMWVCVSDIDPSQIGLFGLSKKLEESFCWLSLLLNQRIQKGQLGNCLSAQWTF